MKLAYALRAVALFAAWKVRLGLLRVFGVLLVPALLMVFAQTVSGLLPSAQADYAPPVAWTVTKNTSTPQVGALIHSGATTLGGLAAWNASGGTAYLEAHDSTTQPGVGTAPVTQSASCASNTYCVVSVPSGGVKLTTGLYIAFSSTGPTYTQAVGNSTGGYTTAWR